MPSIINRHGIYRTVPDRLLPGVIERGGRLATEAEIAARGAGQLVPVDVAEPEPEQDDLTRIKGVGPRTAEALATFGVYSFRDLIIADPVEVAQTIDGSGLRQVVGWQDHAQKLSEADRD